METVFIGDIIKELDTVRKSKGISQFKFAYELDVSLLTYQRWVGGVTRRVRKEHYDKIQEVLEKYKND